MATMKKPIKKAQSGYSATAKRVDSLRAVGSGQLGTPEGEKTLRRLKAAEAQERREDSAKMAKKKPMKKGGMVKKAQNGWSDLKEKASKVKGFGETYGPTVDKLKKAVSSETIKKSYKPLVDKIKAVKLTPKNKMGGKTSKKK